ncbi:hypothetical protein GCM10010967_27120 [Dyadobacter beijingensis]|uniref:Uncharacterized protein n=1 Tax=Dyadobacter beijingensis TaxID=365489 RepID=A0ABQ2HXN8_9BACT|nr:hypothetical protein GCM10010967_27120 [Dyadobacter beijingensis]
MAVIAVVVIMVMVVIIGVCVRMPVVRVGLVMRAAFIVVLMGGGFFVGFHNPIIQNA